LFLSVVVPQLDYDVSLAGGLCFDLVAHQVTAFDDMNTSYNIITLQEENNG